MAKNATIFAASQQPLTLALLVLPQASILEVASTLDPMRSANRHLGSEVYRWRVVSPDGQAVPLTCGIELPSNGPLRAAEGADALIVVAGFQQWQGATPHLIRELSRMAPRFSAVGAIDAGPWVLARAGLLNGYKATVHWEDLEDFATAHPGVDVQPDRFVIDRSRFTAGGAAPAADLMLHLIRDYLADGRIIRIMGKTGEQYVPLIRQPGAIEYDVIVDDAPTSPNQKDRVWSILQQLLPMLKGMGVPMTPELLDYLPLPESLIAAWKKDLQPNPQAQQEEQIKKTVMLEGAKATIRKDNASASKSEAEAAQTVAETQGDKVLALLAALQESNAADLGAAQNDAMGVPAGAAMLR